MEKFESVEALLDYAIAREEDAVAFYTDLATKVDSSWIIKLFKDFAAQEQGHKEKLVDLKNGNSLLAAKEKIMDLKIADYTVDIQVTPEMNYQDALIVAMKREKVSFKLYSDLSRQIDDESVKATLEALAQEEANHKLYIETEYDERVLKEN